MRGFRRSTLNKRETWRKLPEGDGFLSKAGSYFADLRARIALAEEKTTLGICGSQ
jgi:hypothetical protein